VEEIISNVWVVGAAAGDQGVAPEKSNPPNAGREGVLSERRRACRNRRDHCNA